MTTQESGFATRQQEPSGRVLAAISNSMVQLYREHYGRGPTGAKTHAHDDMIVCVLRDGLTPVEKTLSEKGRVALVREMRIEFNDAVADRFKEIIERETGRKVVAFMSQAHMDPDIAIEVFFLDGPMGENGSHEIDGDGHELQPS